MAERILPPSLPRGQPALPGSGVRIEALGAAHAPAFAELIVDPSLSSIPVGRVAREQGAGACLERQLEAARRGRAHWFAVIDADARFAGQVGLVGVHRAQAQLTYWIGLPHRARGLATAAARQAMTYAFDRAGIERLTTVVAEDNVASRRVLEKVGFARAPALDPRPAVLCFTAGRPRPSAAARFVRAFDCRGE